MIGMLAIDFRPGDGTLPRILDTVTGAGFDLCGIRVEPGRSCERSTLRLDIGPGQTRNRLLGLEAQLASIDGIIDVIHFAGTA